jgi:hypothetical protein
MRNRLARRLGVALTATALALTVPAIGQANKGGVPNSHAGNHTTLHRNTSCKDTKRHAARKGKTKGFSKHGAAHSKGLHCGHS